MSTLPTYSSGPDPATAYVVDVRPDRLVDGDSREAFEATTELCGQVGWSYCRVGRAASDPSRESALACRLSEPTKPKAGLRYRPHLALGLQVDDDQRSRPAVGEPILVLPTLYHLLWTHEIDVDIDSAPIGEHTLIRLADTMNAEPAKIAIGDFCRYDGKFCELVAIDGMIAKLRREDGQLAAVKIADLFADSSFDVFSPSVRRRPIPPDYFSTLPSQVQERVLWLEHHISEVVDGIPVGSPPQTIRATDTTFDRHHSGSENATNAPNSMLLERHWD